MIVCFSVCLFVRLLACSLACLLACLLARLLVCLFPTRQEGVVRFYVGIRVCDASTPRPRPVSRQSSSPVDPAEYPAKAARHWIPPSIPTELLPSGSRRVSRQWIPPSIPPERLAPAEHPARAAGQSIPPTQYCPELLAVRLVSGAARQWIPPSIPLS